MQAASFYVTLKFVALHVSSEYLSHTLSKFQTAKVFFPALLVTVLQCSVGVGCTNVEQSPALLPSAVFVQSIKL